MAFFAASSLFTITGINIGCGGSKSQPANTIPATDHGKMRLVINWPPRSETRLIPALTDSVQISVHTVTPDAIVAQTTVVRPATQTYSEAIFNDLPTGEVRIEVGAIPSKNTLSDSVLAFGSTQATITSDKTTEANIVMNSTIDHLTLSPVFETINMGMTYSQSARAENSQGNLVLTLPRNIVRYSDNEAVVTIDSNGVLTPKSPGTARITVRESESRVQTTYSLEVRSFHTGAQIPSAYDLTDLGTPPDNGFNPEAVSLNEVGQVVGFYTPPIAGNLRRGFVWQNGTYTTIAPPAGESISLAYDINNRGQVAAGSNRVAFLWQDGVVTPIATTTYAFGRCSAYSINESGDTVGSDEGSDLPTKTFRRRSDGTITTRPGEHTNYATFRHFDINESGLATIKTYNPALPFYYLQGAFWQSTGNVALLPAPLDSEATALNDAGDAVGVSGSVAVYWKNNATSPKILFPNFPSYTSIATDINNEGLIIGSTSQGNLFISSGGDLPVLLRDITINNASGWTLIRANSINDRGQIVGMGNRNGSQRAFLLTPKP